MGRRLVLPLSARERLRFDTRLDRFEERLRPMERLDDRDDGMPYTYDLENNLGNNRLRCKLVKRLGLCVQQTKQIPQCRDCHTLLGMTEKT